ncbi:MAG: hypothetical protein IPP72_15850 [Chitinophagaceae bacterium]|nr:hypothetical protein [Chitinophagaceae bacterium]
MKQLLIPLIFTPLPGIGADAKLIVKRPMKMRANLRPNGGRCNANKGNNWQDLGSVSCKEKASAFKKKGKVELEPPEINPPSMSHKAGN